MEGVQTGRGADYSHPFCKPPFLFGLCQNIAHNAVLVLCNRVRGSMEVKNEGEKGLWAEW